MTNPAPDEREEKARRKRKRKKLMIWAAVLAGLVFLAVAIPLSIIKYDRTELIAVPDTVTPVSHADCGPEAGNAYVEIPTDGSTTVHRFGWKLTRHGAVFTYHIFATLKPHHDGTATLTWGQSSGYRIDWRGGVWHLSGGRQIWINVDTSSEHGPYRVRVPLHGRFTIFGEFLGSHSFRHCTAIPASKIIHS